MNKRIIITGATGLIGQELTKKLIARGDDVIIVSRSKENNGLNKNSKIISWNNLTELKNEIELADAVIHLAGENVMAKRWSANHKKNIYESRINTTKKLVDLMNTAEIKPKLFVCASAIGFYGTSAGKKFDEHSPSGNDFLANVTHDWESESEKVERFGVRRVSIRTGIALSVKGGALKKMLTPFKLFIGGPLGTGKQYFPWIHIDDLVDLYIFALDNNNVSGPINGVAPEQINMKDFCTKLGEVMNRPSIFSVPSTVIRLLFGEGADAVLSGNIIDPRKTLELGYNFKYTSSKEALKNLLN